MHEGPSRKIWFRLPQDVVVGDILWTVQLHDRSWITEALLSANEAQRALCVCLIRQLYANEVKQFPFVYYY